MVARDPDIRYISLVLLRIRGTSVYSDNIRTMGQIHPSSPLPYTLHTLPLVLLENGLD